MSGEEFGVIRAQLDAYRTAMQVIHPHKAVRCAVIFADGNLAEA